MPPKRKKNINCDNESISNAKNKNTTKQIIPTTDSDRQNKTFLEQFQYRKKTPIKIECEKDSPEKVVGIWKPSNWEEFMENLRKMRINQDAPVDTMGCHKCPDTEVSPKVFRYQSLIALMLSSQTKDQVTFAAMERLKARGLTVDNVLAMPEDELGELIKPVGFWRTKAKYIRKTTQILKDQYDGDIPNSVEKMCKLVGVGPKMAHICMSVAWNTVSGIGVDTHVHRICNRIGWVRKPTPTPESTRKALESWLPNEEWQHVNHLLVGFGQTICTPINPKCLECLNRHICPYKGKVRKSPVKQPIDGNLKDPIKTSDSLLLPIKQEPVFKEEIVEGTPKSDTLVIENKESLKDVKSNTIKKSPRIKKVTEADLKIDIDNDKRSPIKRKLSPVKKLEKDSVIINTDDKTRKSSRIRK